MEKLAPEVAYCVSLINYIKSTVYIEIHGIFSFPVPSCTNTVITDTALLKEIIITILQAAGTL